MDAFSDSTSAALDSDIASVLTGELPPLGMEARPESASPAAARASVAAMLESSGRETGTDGRLLLEGLTLLWHGDWDSAHEIAQSREGTPDYDLLHAIVHRREGDFGNSCYWFRKAGKHPCYPLLERRLADPRQGLLDFLTPQGRWSPDAFLHQVSAGLAGSAETKRLLRQVQAEESRAFAEHLLAVPLRPVRPPRG
ncbi:MAG: hypothetical protein ABI036_12320 [Fibrobacteria bacterium]